MIKFSFNLTLTVGGSHRHMFHSKNICPLLFLPLVSLKKYMPLPLPYFKVNICPFPLPHFASIFFAYL
jgi:hypothetical protein